MLVLHLLSQPVKSMPISQEDTPTGFWRVVQNLRKFANISNSESLKKMDRGEPKDQKDGTGKYYLLRDEEDSRFGIYDKPLPCFGCGIGWFSFLVGFMCPLTWYYATILYFGNYYRKDPRERGGLAASAIAALICSVVACIAVAAIVL